jgi:hypothetical protein
MYIVSQPSRLSASGRNSIIHSFIQYRIPVYFSLRTYSIPNTTKIADKSPIVSSNPAITNLDRVDVEMLSAAATVASDEEATRPGRIIRQAGKTYTQNVLRDSKKKPRTSWVWKYGWEMEETPTPAGSDRKKIKWVCKVCRESKGFTSYDSDSTTQRMSRAKNCDTKK